MNNIEDNICQAIDIIVQRAIAQADYDKTIQATIIECVDQSIGRYKIRYQDSTFYAYSSSSDVSYSSGTLVYVLIPAGNMSKDKTILGAVKNLGTNYVVETQGEDRYNIVGDNCIKDEKNQTFGLKSYLPTRYVKTLYAKDKQVENVISVNEASLKEYIKEADSIVCAATFKTALAAEQQFNGNYGLLIAIDFADNSTGELITREYVLDVNRMQGNPYRLINDTRQVVIFDVDGANYAGVNNISIFCYDFPHNKPEDQCEEDIWIKNIELSVAKRKTQEELNGYSISFVTTKGTCFDQTHTEDDALTIKAQVRVKGKIVDPSTQTVDFYWFIEDVNVTSQSEKNYIYYNQYGGQGWRCLNESNLVEAESPDERATVQWTPAGDTWSVVKKTVAAKETVFKCVAIYDGIAISKEITIKRLDSQWDVTIVSDQGTQFYFDSGKTTLTCLVNGESKPSDYTYCWANINKDDYFSTLAETVQSNTTYDELVKKYNDLKGKIEREEVLASQSEQELNNLSNQINSFDKVTRVDKNVVYNVVANSISSFSVFKCSVYQGDTFLGTGSITLVNSLSAEGVWSVVLHDGTQIFKYNERGVSPAEASNLRPTVLVPLTFTVYDNLGNAVEDSAVNAKDVQWIVPMEQTMLKMSAEGDYVDNEDGTRTYVGLKTFPYEIASSYNIRNQKNDITLLVDYKGMRLTAMTDFVFTKQGESGTNGSDYICRIVPNCADGCPDAPMVTKIAPAGSVQWNFNPATANVPFKVQLWHNDDIIFTGTQSGTSSEGKDVTVIWSMLQNKYTASVSDASTFTVNKDTGAFTYGTFNEANPANILKVEVRHNEVTYYDDMPIITALVNSGFNVRLKRHTGFDHVLYSSDGKKPIYDNSEPFELEVTELINGWTEDISLKEEQYALEYTWYPLGTIMEKYPPEQVNDISLIEARMYGQEELNKNQKAYKVIDTYDGQCVNNAVQCLIEQSGTQVAKIHMPVHLMLDRYSNSAVNGWDGNSVSISDEGGFILAPQMGAGYKETDNSFTGVVMGKVKEGLSAEEVGLFGYYYGQRSIFLDAKTGIARFGLAGSGQIVIDPTSNTAKLYSGDYEEGKGGMLIDLTTPEIKYGNGNFSVNKDGQLIAKGDGSRIADCVIKNGKLEVPAANITGQLVAGQIAVGAVNTDNLSETLNDYIESIQSAAEAAQGTADSATAAAGAAQSSANAAQGSADAANAAAGKAQSAADAANTAAGKAQSTADAATQKANDVDKIIAEWCWNHDVTYIDGAHIYTGTVTADKIDVNDLFAQNITAKGTITGLTLKGANGEFSGTIKASSGYIGGESGFTIESNKLYTNGHSAYNSAGSGVYIGTDYISLGSGGVTWFKSDGAFQLGGSNGIKYDGYTMTLGSSIHLSWGQVTGTDNIATKGEIPTTAQITQITKDTVTTSYVNALKITAEWVAAEHITGTTITGKVFSGCTGEFSGTVKASQLYINGNYIYSGSGTIPFAGPQGSGSRGISSDPYPIMPIINDDDLDIVEEIPGQTETVVDSQIVNRNEYINNLLYLSSVDGVYVKGCMGGMAKLGTQNLYVSSYASINEIITYKINANTMYENGTPLSSKYLSRSTADSLYATTSSLSSYVQKNSSASLISLELSYSTPFIDFHYGRSAKDFTQRIIASASDRLEIITSGTSAGIYVGGLSSKYGIFPTLDNTWELGGSSHRWAHVYAASGAVSTSDERDKNIIGTLKSSVYKRIYMSLQPILYTWKEQGLDPNKVHMGLGAQTVEKRFKENGFNPDKIGMIQHDYWERETIDPNERTDRYGFNYAEVAVWTIPIVQEHETEIQMLKAQIEYLMQTIKELKGGK